MEFFNDKVKLKFIPKKVISFDKIKKENLIMTNDVYEKYNATTNILGELIICNDISKTKQYNSKKIIKESYEEYLNFINNYDIKNDKWIYNIIDKVSEQDKVIFRNDFFIIMPNYTWNEHDISKLHILAIVTDKNIRSIRDLNSSHISLLNDINSQTLVIIKKKYDIDADSLKIFFHYEPSTYILHIHYVNINYIDARSSVEYSHELSNVIFNLTLDNDYYKKILLNKFIN
jgi:m7GpppX diphosphatase